MSLTAYDFIPQLILSLNALKGVVQKGRAYAEQKKVDFSVLLQTRLAVDQFPLVRQIQIATDNAKGCAARLAGIDPPKMEDKEQTFEEVMDRLDRTIAFLKTIKPEQLNGWESRKVTFPWRPGVYLEARDYLVQHALPNFYFHMTTAYDVLRASGVDVGKADYLGAQSWKQSA